MFINALLAIAIPLIFLYIIWTLEIYAVTKVKFLIGAFAWGIASFFIAYAIQTGLLSTGLVNFQEVSQITAPILEELLKTLLIFFLMQRMLIRYPVDGAAYGFAIGTGFAVFENMLYLSQAAGPGFQTAVARSFSVSLMHAFATGIVGALAGSVVFYRIRTRAARISLGLLIAIVIHALFNQVAAQAEGLTLIVAGIFIGLAGTALIIFIIERSLQAERREIDAALSNQLGAGERAASLNPQELARILAENKHVLGEQRMTLVTQYTHLQAQRGILRKTIHFNRRAGYQETLKNQLGLIESRLADLRREMGLYTWIWLRSVLPSEESGLWAELGQHVDVDQPIMTLLIKLGERQEEVGEAEMMARVELLRSGTLFDQLPEEELEDLALLMRGADFEVGEEVVRRGRVDERLFLVATGTLVASVTDNFGSETILNGYKRGDTFGELSLIDLHEHPATVTAMDTTRLYTLARTDLITLIFAKPQVGLEMMRQLVNQIRRQTALLMWVQESYQNNRDEDALDTQIKEQLQTITMRIKTGPLDPSKLDAFQNKNPGTGNPG